MEKPETNTKVPKERMEASDEKGYPIFLTPNQASSVSGLGINTIRRLLKERKIDYLPTGSHKRITRQALLDYYEREKVPAEPS